MKINPVLSMRTLVDQVINEGLHETKMPIEEWLYLIRISKDQLKDHQCQGSLMRCCNEFRCEVCHLQHMHEEHSKAAVQTFGKFHSSHTIVRDAVAPKPLPERKEVKKLEKTHKRSTELTVATQNAILAADLASLEKAALAIAEKLRNRRK